MLNHLINSNNLKSKKSKEISPKPRRENISSFGPSLGKLKQIEVSKKVRKMIHYDCNENAYLEGLDDDIPDEDEVYIKENLLVNLKERQQRERDNHITESNNEDLSIVNINVSILFSEETISNSKNNSLTFNYSPDSTSRMNNTKSIFNSAKNTLKSHLNKSNSNNNLLTDNTFTNNSIYNTLNSNYSRDKKESPGNPYLMEKITSLLNKNKPTNNYNFNSFSNNQPSSTKNISNRDFINNQYNNVNIHNFNFNNNITQKNLNTIDIIDSPEKIISEKLGKNLLDIMQEKFSKSNNKHQNSDKNENCKNNDFFNDSIDTENKIKTTKTHEESKSIYEEYKLKFDNSKNPNQKLNAGNYFSPPSSKKRLVEKFYNHTENKINHKNHLYHNLLEKKSKNEIVIRDSLRISLNSNNQKDLIANFKYPKGHKFDFSRYNYKSQDFTALLTNRNLQEGKLQRHTIISNDSKETNSKSHSRDKSDNLIKNNKNNFNNFDNFTNKSIPNENNNNNHQIHVLDNKSIINTDFDHGKSGIILNNNTNDYNTMEIVNNNILTIDTNKKTKKENQICNKTKIDKSLNNFKDLQTTARISNEKTNKENINQTNLNKISKKNLEDEEKVKEKNTLIIRDVKSLHIITQKALTTKNNIISLGDTIEEDGKKTIFNLDSSDKALFIDDNSDMPVGVAKSQDPFSYERNKSNNMITNFENVVCKTDSNFKSPQLNSFTYTNALNNNYNISEKDRKQIINIININNNYNIGNLNFTSADNIYSITNPNSNFKENNSKSKYNAFLMSNENSKTKKISNSNSNYNKTKNRIDPKKMNKNVSSITNTSNPSMSTTNNININNKTSVEKSSNSMKSSSNISSLNNQNSANLFNKQQLSNMNCDNTNFINNIYINSNLNTPTMNSKNNKANNQFLQSNKENNVHMNSIVEILNTSKEKNIPHTSKNASNYFFLENTSIDSNKLPSKDDKIKEILKICKKDENKNKFIKISSSNKNK